MTHANRILRMPAARSTAMAVAPETAERQLRLSLWLIGFLIAGTLLTTMVDAFI